MDAERKAFLMHSNRDYDKMTLMQAIPMRFMTYLAVITGPTSDPRKVTRILVPSGPKNFKPYNLAIPPSDGSSKLDLLVAKFWWFGERIQIPSVTEWQYQMDWSLKDAKVPKTRRSEFPTTTCAPSQIDPLVAMKER